MTLEVKVLGGVDVLVDGQPLPLGGSKQRGVLAMLALRANRTVPSDELIDGLWGERPPASAAKNVQLYVSRLRKALGDGGPARIITHGRGYALELEEDAVDALRLERLLERGRPEVERGIAGGAIDAALELWGGAPLADVASEPFAAAEIRRLEELHLRAIELAIDAELAAGRDGGVLADLEALLAQNPLHERFHAQRMLALYRAGRQGDALEAYREAHRILAREVGVEPGPELRELQQAILEQDPQLDGPPPVQELPRPLSDGSPILAGREHELRWLRKRWRAAEAATSEIALIAGSAGIGKTRLAAELAAELAPTGAAVAYAAGSRDPEAALTRLAEVERSERPTLLVLDDADDAPPRLLEAARSLCSSERGAPLLLLVLHRDEQGPPAFAGQAQRLRLRPLQPEAAAEIAELYRPAEGEAIPIEPLIADSEGVPLRVHRAASDWVVAEAGERLEAQVERASGDRGEQRAAESGLAGSIADLQAARERAHAYATADEGADPGLGEVCPYRGLAPFDAAHAEFFFGRERLVARLVARLVGSSFLAVVGPSGSGKSSAVRAGLLPSLADAALPGAERWQQVLIRPGERPLAELAGALLTNGSGGNGGDSRGGDAIADAADALAPGERLVLAVDQFEEVFTACRTEREREAFIEGLVAAAEDPDRRLVVVLAIRADFYGRCAEHPELASLISANQVLVGPMRREELRRAIELPAHRVGLGVEPRLISALVGDVAEQRGGLPLLSTTLVELWEQRSGRALRRSSYEASGGVSAAVARLAERAYERLTPAQRERARAILLRLTEAEESEPVRRRVPLAELEVDTDEEVAAVLAVLTERRLLTVDEDSVEVAHEALLREWPRLRDWLAADSEGRRLHQHLIGAAAEWERSGREPAELYRGARLAAALEWAAGHEDELNELEREFLNDSHAASEKEAERQRRQNRRLRALLAGVGVLLAAAVVAGVVALSERGSARDAETIEAAEQLGAQALTEPRPDRALQLASAGIALDDSLATRSNLLRTLLRSPAALDVLEVEGERLMRIALSPDGKTLAIGEEGGTIGIFDAETRERIGTYKAPGLLDNLVFAPDGSALAVASQSGPTPRPGRPASLHMIDPRTQELAQEITVEAPPNSRPGDFIFPVPVFAPDGRSVIVANVANATGPELRPSFLQRFDVSTGETIGRPVGAPPLQSWPTVFPTPDGRLIYANDEESFAIDAETLRVSRRYRAGAPSAVASPDGGTLMLGGRDGAVRLLDLETGKLSRLPGGHREPVVSAAFTRDGRTLVTGAEGGDVIVWDLRLPEPGFVAETRPLGRAAERLQGHDGDVVGMRISPDGRTLYTASTDGTAIAWDLGGERRFGARFTTGLAPILEDRIPPAFAISPDGGTVAVARLDGRVDLVDAEALRRIATFQAFEEAGATAIEYSPDGEQLAVAGQRGFLGLLDSDSGEPIGPLLSEPRGRCASPESTYTIRGCTEAGSQSIAFSPDGRTLAMERGSGDVEIWDLERRELSSELPRLPPFALWIDFSPDGSQLAVTFGYTDSEENGIAIFDVESGERTVTLRGAAEPRSVAFSPDGSVLASSHIDGTALLWSTDDWRRVGPPLSHEGFLLSVRFSPDGRLLATSSDNGTTALWDVATRQRIGTPLPRMTDRRDPTGLFGTERWNTSRFSPDGRRLFAVFETGNAVRWDLDPAAWRAHACAVAGGGLTPEQWDLLVPEQDFRESCPE